MDSSARARSRRVGSFLAVESKTINANDSVYNEPVRLAA
jgi:hypothetical protein